MKRLICTLLMVIVLSNVARAEYVLPFEVQYSSKFYNGLPIVTDLFNGYFYDNLNEPDGPRLGLMDVIAGVNGTAVMGMGHDAFKELCAQSEELELDVVRKYDKGDWVYKIKIRQKNNLNGYGDLKAIRQMSNISHDAKMNNKEFQDAIRIFCDSEVDFQNYYTYDIMVTGDDPLVDKNILETFCKSGLFSRYQRDEENPDLIVCLARSAEESISSTYVPPTTQVVNEGSFVQPVYNYITRSTSYVIKQHNREKRTEGYTQTTTNSNINLEITVLDAKKLNAPGQKTAPILWQMKYSQNITNRESQIVDIYMQVARNNTFPFTQPQTLCCYSFAMCGARFKPYDENSAIVASEVVPGSNADRLGLRKGDIITKVNGNKSFKITMSAGTHLEFNPKIRCSEISEITTIYNKNNTKLNTASNVNIWLVECNLCDPVTKAKGIRVGKYKSPLHNPKTKYTIKRGGETIVLTGQLSYDPLTLSTFEGTSINWKCFENLVDF